MNFAPYTPCTLSPVGAAELSGRFDMETISYHRNDRKFLKYLRDLKINRGKYYCVVKLSAESGTSATLVEVRKRSSFSVKKGPTLNGAEKKNASEMKFHVILTFGMPSVRFRDAFAKCFCFFTVL